MPLSDNLQEDAALRAAGIDPERLRALKKRYWQLHPERNAQPDLRGLAESVDSAVGMPKGQAHYNEDKIQQLLSISPPEHLRFLKPGIHNYLELAQGAIYNTGRFAVSIPKSVFTMFDRAEQGTKSLLLAAKGKEPLSTFRQRVAPETLKSPVTGKTAFGELMDSVSRRMRGVESPKAPFPAFYREPDVERLSTLDLLRVFDDNDAVDKLEQVEKMPWSKAWKDPEAIGLKMFNLLGSMFLSVDAFIPAKYFAMPVKGAIKAVRGVKEAALAKQLGPATYDRLMTIRAQSTPEMMAGRALAQMGKKLPGVGEYIADARFPQLGYLRGSPVISDPDKLFPKMTPEIEGRLKRMGDWIKSRKETMDPRQYREVVKGAVANIGQIKRSYGREVASLIAEDIVERQGPTPLTGLLAHKMGFLSLIADPHFVIPDMYQVATHGHNRYTEFLTKTSKKVAEEMSPIERGSEASARIFRALNSAKGPVRDSALAKLSTQERVVYDLQRSFYDEAAMKLGLKPDMKIEGYAPHVFPKELFGKSIPPEFHGIATKGNINFNHLRPRAGAEGYIEDIYTAMDSYLPGYARKLHMQPAIDQMVKMRGAYQGTAKRLYAELFIREVSGKPAPISQLTTLLFDAANETLARMPIIGRPLQKVTKSAIDVTNAFYYGMLGWNLGFATKNLFQGINTASRTSWLSYGQGISWFMTKDGRRMAKEAGVNIGDLFAKIGEYGIGPEQILGTKKLVFEGLKPTIRKAAEAGEKGTPLSKVLGGTAYFTESFNRGVAYWAGIFDYAKRNGFDKGPLGKQVGRLMADPEHWAKASNYGLQISEETQFVYGVLGRSPVLPQLMGGKAARMVGQFQGFYIKQLEFVLGAHDDFGMGLNWILYSGMASRALAGELGIDGTGFVGLGQMIPTMHPDQLPFSSPSTAVLTNLGKVLISGANNDIKGTTKAIENLTELMPAMIPTWLGVSKLVKGFRRAYAEEITAEGGRVQIEPLGPESKAAAVIGLPSQAAATRKRLMDRMQRYNQISQLSGDKLKEDFWDATKRGDEEGRQRAWNGLTEMGFGPQQMKDSLRAMIMASEMSILHRAMARNKPAAVRSGALSEALKSREGRRLLGIREE